MYLSNSVLVIGTLLAIATDVVASPVYGNSQQLSVRDVLSDQKPEIDGSAGKETQKSGQTSSQVIETRERYSLRPWLPSYGHLLK